MNQIHRRKRSVRNLANARTIFLLVPNVNFVDTVRKEFQEKLLISLWLHHALDREQNNLASRSLKGYIDPFPTTLTPAVKPPF